jgi:hypothetical protein
MRISREFQQDLALTLEGQAQILRRGDVVIDDSAGVSLQTVEQRLGRSLSNDERQFVSEALNAQQSTDAHFTEIAQRLGGQYVAPSEDEIHRIVDRGLKSQRGSDSFTLIDSSREPADLSEAIRKIQYSSDGLPVNIQWYAPGDATPYAISRFDIGGYIIRPAIRVEDPNYITLFRGVGRVVPERAEVPPMVRNGVATIEDLQALIAKGNKMTDQDVIDLLSKSPSAKKEQLIADFKSEAVRIRQKLGPQTSTLEVISDIHADCGANSECLSFLISSTNDFDFAFEWATGKKSPRTSASGAEAVEILRVPRDRTINLIENGINPEEQEVAILGAIEDIWRQGVIYVRAKNIDEYHQVLNRFGQSRNAMEEAGRTVIPFEVAGRLLDAAENIPPLPGVAVIPDIARVVNDITDGFDNASTTNLRVSELEEQARLAREFGDADQAYQLEVEAQALRVQGTNCNLTSIPQSPNLALANLTTNVLGVSTQGEVLAVSASNCGPFATAWLEMSKSQGGKVLDTMTNGKLFDAYTEIFVKVDASLPEPVLNIGNQVIGLFKKPADSLDQAAKITPAPIVKEIPILKPMVEETPKFSKKLSADEQFISEYFDQIKTGQVADGQFMLYFDPISGKIVTTNVSASDIVPLEIQIFRNSDSSLDISSLRIPSEYAYGNSIYSIINTLEELTDSRVLHINQTSKQKLFALEGTIPAIIQPDLVTMTSVLLTKPDVARLYANRQIEQNWLNKNLENLLGDNYINLRQKALPPDPYREVPKQLDTSYSQYKAGEINETQLIEQVEAIAGIHSQSQKIQEIPLFIDERFLRTGLLAGRDIEDIKHWFGAGEWAGWLGARKVAQSYGNRPLSASFINNLHQALLLPASPKENVLIGDFRLSAMFGFKKDNPGEFPISKITVINENPYLKFIETPVPEGKIARPDATKWGYIQYPRVGDADFMNSLPDHIKAKLSPRPTNQELVQVLVEDVIDWYNTQSNLPGVDRIALAAELQRRLISVHPFGDANGRLSRIVMNWSLENAGYPAPRIVNFNADIESPLEQWIETVRNGIAREQKVQEKLKLMEEIGWVDPVEALGYSELKTFYDLMAKNGNFTNSSRLLPEVNGQIKRTPYGSLNDLNRDIVLAWNNFHKMFGGESQVLPDGTKITVGGLVPQSYIDLVRMKNPKNFEAYEKLIKEFYSNRDVTVYRGIPISTPADTPQRVAALFETPRSALNSYYSNTFSSSKSPRFLRLENPNMPSTDVLKESLARGLENYNESVIDDYTDILDDETIQMEDKIDSLRRKIKIHTVGNSLETDVSPFVSVSTSKGVADNFAGGEYYNLFFNNSTGKPNKRQASIVVTSKLPAQGVVPTFNTGYQVIGFTNSQPQIIPGIGGLLSIHTGELEILVPGGMNPAHIERIQVKVRTNDISDPSWKSYKFDAVKSIKDDGVYVEVKEMVIGSDGHATGSVRQTTLFKLNPSTGKYQEVSTINTVEDILNSIINNPILKGFTATNLATS